jgi:5-methylcytosine-specific restriction enzyme subunit McrC
MTWTVDSPLRLEAYNDASPPQTLTDGEIRYLTEGIEIQYEGDTQAVPTKPVTLRQVVGGTEVTANGYAGTIRLPSGRAIELRPSMSARNFLWLAKYAYDLDLTFVSESTSTSLTSGDVTLNAFTALYLSELRDLLDSGLRPGYQRVERRRGNIDIQRQLQQQPLPPMKFESVTDELTYDTPLNRAVYHATRRLADIVNNNLFRDELRVRIRTLRQYVSTDPISPVEIEVIDLLRLESSYTRIFPLVTTILRGQYFGGKTGDQRASCLLVKMWNVFQWAVERAFRVIERQKSDITLQTQVVLHNPGFIDGDQFVIRPDFIIQDSNGTPVLVADTKWKPRENPAIYQIVTYQMILDVPGLLLYPEESEVDQNHIVDSRYPLRLVSLPTATEAISYEGFVRGIEQSLRREMDRLLDS